MTRRFANRLPVLAAMLVLAPAAQASFPLKVELTAATVQYGDIRLVDVKLASVDSAGLALDVSNARLNGQEDLQVRDVSLQCSELGGRATGWCEDGEWRLVVQSLAEPWEQEAQGEIAEAVWNEQSRSISSSLSAGEFQARLTYRPGNTDGPKAGLSLDWSAQELGNLPFRALLPEQLDWIKGGSTNGQLSMQPGGSDTDASSTGTPPNSAIGFQLEFQNISLDSPDGRYAAEGVHLKSGGKFQPGSTAELSLKTRFLAGQVLLDQFYTEIGPDPLLMDASLSMNDDRVEVRELRIDDGRSLRLQASAGFEMSHPAETLNYQVRQLDMQFPLAYQKYLEPVLASWTLDKLTVTGGLNWKGSGSAGEFPSGTLSLQDLSVVDHEQDRFAFTGMTANIQVGQSIGQSQFSWRGLLLGRINLGGGEISLNTAPGHFELAEPLQLAVLGGKFSVDEFSLELPAADADGADPVVSFNAGLHDLDMEQLTAALGWPTFPGKVSGRIPGASFDQGVLTVDGVLAFEAFDGRIELSDLRVERIFGVLPSFAANLEMSNLDLEMLTGAFSFGSIAGRLDGYVHELRMLDWSPVSFDAWMGTPEGQADSRSISRQAVNNLTSIGGGGATAALTGPVMRLFSNFSYKRLGMGCRLENYVCSVRGLADEDNSVVIMEGSGIPKLSIRVFNRRMDWPQLVSNLEAATSGGDIRIGNP